MARPLDVGDKVPDFTLSDQDGQPVALASALARGPVVVFFYPADETPTCTREACAFRDAHAELQGAGASVFGISGDSVASHQRFAASHKLPYRLLADEGDRVRKTIFRVPRGLVGLRPGRATYVLDKDGVIRLRFQRHLEAQEHIDRAMAVVKELKKG